MIRKIFPAGILIIDLVVEDNRGDWSLARPLASYPITVNIPRNLKVLSRTDVFIIDYRERSLVGLSAPFDIRNASLQELKQIPGISRKAGEIFIRKDKSSESLSVSPIFEKIKQHLI